MTTGTATGSSVESPRPVPWSDQTASSRRCPAPCKGFQVRLQRQAMEVAFLPTGGVASGDGFAQLLREGYDQPISKLARSIVNRDVVSFEVQGQIWLPMFQFDPSTLDVRPAVKAVIDELRGVFDEWDLAEWFARPNWSLSGRSPASEVLRDEQAVLAAARVDRFVAAG